MLPLLASNSETLKPIQRTNTGLTGTNLYHSRAVVDDQRLDLLISHFILVS